MSDFGNARWASLKEIQQAGMTNPGGLYLGCYQGHDLYHNGEGHILTVALPGGGKSSALAIPTLLTYRGGSLIVTDPKGELAAVTARHRRDQLGQEVVILNPFRAEISQGFGVDLGDTGYNPLAGIEWNDYARADAALIGSILIPDKPGEKDFWRKGARNILVGLLLYLVWKEPPGRRTLPRLNSVLHSPPKILDSILDEMLGSGDSRLVDAAGRIETNRAADEQWSGMIEGAQQATDIFSEAEPLGRHVSSNAFNPADLKRRNMTVYIVLPAHRQDDNKAWQALVLAQIGEAIGRPGPARECVMICDEFANLGPVPTIARAMANYRGMGLKVWLLVQSSGQLTDVYGRDKARVIKELCETKQVFNLGDDPEQAAEVSKMMGNSWAISGQHSQTSVPFMRPEDITKNISKATEKQIIIRAGLWPILADLVSYFKRPDWSAWADENPYYRGRVAPPATPAPAQNTKPPLRKRLTNALIVIALIIFGRLAYTWLFPDMTNYTATITRYELDGEEILYTVDVENRTPKMMYGLGITSVGYECVDNNCEWLYESTNPITAKVPPGGRKTLRGRFGLPSAYPNTNKVEAHIAGASWPR